MLPRVVSSVLKSSLLFFILQNYTLPTGAQDADVTSKPSTLELIEALRSSKFAAREQATELLSEMPEAESILLGHLNDPSADFDTRVKTILATFNKQRLEKMMKQAVIAAEVGDLEIAIWTLLQIKNNADDLVFWKGVLDVVEKFQDRSSIQQTDKADPKNKRFGKPKLELFDGRHTNTFFENLKAPSKKTLELSAIKSLGHRVFPSIASESIILSDSRVEIGSQAYGMIIISLDDVEIGLAGECDHCTIISGGKVQGGASFSNSLIIAKNGIQTTERTVVSGCHFISLEKIEIGKRPPIASSQIDAESLRIFKDVRWFASQKFGFDLISESGWVILKRSPEAELLGRLDYEDGDRVLSINGVVVENLSHAQKLFPQKMAEGECEILVQRGSRTRKLNFVWRPYRFVKDER